MTNDYTPTTSDIRSWWAEDQNRTHGDGDEAHMAEFDRWLADHDKNECEAAFKKAAKIAERWVEESTTVIRYTDKPIVTAIRLTMTEDIAKAIRNEI